MSIREELYKQAARRPVTRYFEAWSEILTPLELGDLIAWFDRGAPGDPPAPYIQRLVENPEVAQRVKAAGTEFKVVRWMFGM